MIQKLKAIWAILRSNRYAIFAINDAGPNEKDTAVYAALIPKKDAQYIRFIETLKRDAIIENTEGAPVVDPRLN